MSIPRRLIQTAKSADLSPLAKASAKNLRLLHPDWEYLFFDDAAVSEFVANEFPEYRDVFARFEQPIQRSDFFRYLAVFRLGGFYFDLDVFLSEPLEGLLQEECVFPFEELTISRFLREKCGTDWEIGNYAFGAAQNNAFLGSVIRNCMRAQGEPSWLEPMMRGVPRILRSEFSVLNTTGPGILTRTLAEEESGRGVTVLFPPDVCNTHTWHQFGPYGIHLMQGSWRDQRGWLWRRSARMWESWVRARNLRASKAEGPTRTIGASAHSTAVAAI